MQLLHLVIKRYHFLCVLFSVAIVALFLLKPCSADADFQFVDKTIEAGLSYPLSQSYGLSWGDFNNDNMIDLHIRNHGDPPSLYQNMGNGIFENITLAVNLWFSADFHGASWGDFDNDGDLDLYQALGADYGQGTKTNFLFKNQDNVLFTDIGGSAGVQDPLGRGRTPLWFDYNADGNLDLYIANAKRVDAPSVLFRNDGYDSFTDVTESAGIKAVGSNVGAYVADINGDAVLDLIVSSRWEGISLYSNNSDGTFEEVTEGSGLSGVKNVTDLALGDYDNDGDVDIFACRSAGVSDAYSVDQDTLYYQLMLHDTEKGFDFEVMDSPVVEFDLYFVYTKIPSSYVYIGAGGYHPDDIPFSLDANSPENHGEPTRTTAGIYIWFDVLDGYWHVRYFQGEIIINYTLSGIISPLGSLGQVNSINLQFDLGNYNNRLYKNSGRGKFANVTYSTGLAQDYGNAVSAVFSDFDNDGDLDLYVVYNTGERGIFNAANKLYENDGEGHFTEVAASAGAQALVEGRGGSVAVADYNNDGFVDMMILNGAGPAPFSWGQRVLLENQTNNNNWIQLKLIGNVSNRDAVGSIVYLEAGALNLMRQQTGGMHRASQNSQILHFGLANQATVNEILVHWPSGMGQRMTNIASNQRLEIEEPEPVVSLDLVPDRSTVRRGEVVGIRVTATNLTGRYQGFLFGTNVSLPDGDMYPSPPAFLFGPHWVRLAPYETRTRVINHEVPVDAPIGAYVYNGAAGRKPWRVWYEDRFKFAVTPSP